MAALRWYRLLRSDKVIKVVDNTMVVVSHKVAKDTMVVDDAKLVNNTMTDDTQGMDMDISKMFKNRERW